jgi:hypothetical protein
MHWRARTWIDPAAERVAELVLGWLAISPLFFFCCYNGMFFHSVLAPGLSSRIQGVDVDGVKERVGRWVGGWKRISKVADDRKPRPVGANAAPP